MDHDYRMPEAESDNLEYELNVDSESLNTPIIQRPVADKRSARRSIYDQVSWDNAFNDLYSVAFESARSILKGRFESECEDIAMETLTEVISENVGTTSFQELRPLSAAIARNKSKDRLRRYLADKRGGNRVQSLDHMKDAGFDYDVVAPQEDFLDALTVTEVRDLLSELSLEVKKEYRLILKDYFFDQLSHSEIANKREIATSSVGKYLQRGISSMRGILERRPKLQKELRSILSDEYAITVLLPLISAIQMLPYKEMLGGMLCSAPLRPQTFPASDSQTKKTLSSASVRSDDQIMLSAPDELPIVRTLTLSQHRLLAERWKGIYSSNCME